MSVRLTSEEKARLHAAQQQCCGGLHDIVPTIEAIVHERLQAAGTMLLRKATAEFEQHGGTDPRGAAIWDAGCYLRERYDEAEQLEAARWEAQRSLEATHGEGTP